MPNQRRFVIVDQDKYNDWLKKKSEGVEEKLPRGEVSAIKQKPRQANLVSKKLSDHSLTRMTKRSFKTRTEKAGRAEMHKTITPRSPQKEEEVQSSPVQRPKTAKLSPNV